KTFFKIRKLLFAKAEHAVECLPGNHQVSLKSCVGSAMKMFIVLLLQISGRFRSVINGLTKDILFLDDIAFAQDLDHIAIQPMKYVIVVGICGVLKYRVQETDDDAEVPFLVV